MSIYEVNKILYMSDNDPSFRKQMAEPASAIAGFRLTEEERTALLNGDLGKLRAMGVHAFLLNHMSRYELCGVNRDNYLDRIREGMPYDERFELGKMPVQRFTTQ